MPFAVGPVKVTRFTPGWFASAAPVPAPRPVTTLYTPGGNPASSTSLLNSSVNTGVKSEGFTIIVHPAASAGANFRLMRKMGEFHGVIAATTPTGSSGFQTKKSLFPVGTVSPWILSARPAK
jgi:hypothetical protein